jgi:hypothetical protein
LTRRFWASVSTRSKTAAMSPEGMVWLRLAVTDSSASTKRCEAVKVIR